MPGGSAGCRGDRPANFRPLAEKESLSPGHPLEPERDQVSLGRARHRKKDKLLLFMTMFIRKPRLEQKPLRGDHLRAGTMPRVLHLSPCTTSRQLVKLRKGFTGSEAAQKPRHTARKWPRGPWSSPRQLASRPIPCPRRGRRPSQNHFSKRFGEAEAQSKRTPSLGENDKGWKLGQLQEEEKKLCDCKGAKAACRTSPSDSG